MMPGSTGIFTNAALVRPGWSKRTLRTCRSSACAGKRLNSCHSVDPQSRHRGRLRRCFYPQPAAICHLLKDGIVLGPQCCGKPLSLLLLCSAQWDKGQPVFPPLCFWFTPPLGKCCRNSDLQRWPFKLTGPTYRVRARHHRGRWGHLLSYFHKSVGV